MNGEQAINRAEGAVLYEVEIH